MLIGGGVASFVYSGSLADQAKSDCLARVTCDDKRGDIRLFDSLALGGFIAGAGLGAFAIYEWASGGSEAEAKRSTMLIPGPSSLTLRGTF